jgi:hypothetical protein
MSRAIKDAIACGAALARLPELHLGELRQLWRTLYKAQASQHLSRELLVQAVAHRMQEDAFGGLRPGRLRQLRQFAHQFKQTGAAMIRARPEPKPGTRLVREWQGRTYEVLVLDDGFSWQDTHHRSLSDHRHRVVRAAFLRVEAKAACHPPLLATAGPNRRANGG